MKKRVFVIIASLVLIVTGLLVSTQYGIRRENEIVVAAPIIEVSPVLTELKNWPRWFHSADDYQFQLVNSSPAGLTVKSARGNIKSLYVIAAYPDSFPSSTHIKWTTLISGFDWLKQKLFFIDDNPGTRLNGLKKYFEDPKEYYGFDIKFEKAVDTLVLTKDTVVKKTAVAAALGGLFEELKAYAAKEGISTNIDTCRMATFYDETKDSIHVAAGIPISRRVSTRNGIRLLEIPVKGKILVARYQGPYKDISRLYNAMRKYVLDKKYIVVGSPYEKYSSGSSSPRDSLNMTIELHTPVL